MLGPRVNAAARRRVARSDPPFSAGRSAPRRRRRANRAGSAWPTGSWADRSSCYPDARLPARGRHAVPPPRARASPMRLSCPRASRAARPRSPCSRDFRAGETSPIVVLADVGGRPPTRRMSSGAATSRRHRWRSPASTGSRARSRPQGPGHGRRARRRRDRRPVLPPARSAAARARGRPDPLEETYIRGSTVRLDAISPLAPLSPPATAVVPARPRRRPSTA